ncbi:hypothetical protein WISP_113575 [Willisornis vidua]|uniref:Uncharacterized protein n=1 Tax=Willisornis vidua TaxID=1566151 RepID=A0ABQ9D0X0_9PASS|nr:hypothetical protein WISP_113575 [Willisornis vidua]
MEELGTQTEMEVETQSVEVSGTQTEMKDTKDTLTEMGTQTIKPGVVIAPVVKKNSWTRRSTGAGRLDTEGATAGDGERLGLSPLTDDADAETSSPLEFSWERMTKRYALCSNSFAMMLQLLRSNCICFFSFDLMKTLLPVIPVYKLSLTHIYDRRACAVYCQSKDTFRQDNINAGSRVLQKDTDMKGEYYFRQRFVQKPDHEENE